MMKSKISCRIAFITNCCPQLGYSRNCRLQVEAGSKKPPFFNFSGTQTPELVIVQTDCFKFHPLSPVSHSTSGLLNLIVNQNYELHIRRLIFTNFSGSSYFFYQLPEYPRDCEEVRDQCSSATLNSTYVIKPDGYPEPFEVYCESVDCEVWTVCTICRVSSSLKRS